jgi:hypothetical protein
MEIPPPQYPSFPFVPLIPKQALTDCRLCFLTQAQAEGKINPFMTEITMLEGEKGKNDGTYELRVWLSKLLRYLSVRQRHFKYCFKQSIYIYMVRVLHSYPSFREHRPELTWITIQVSLGRAEAVYSSSQIVFKNGVPRSSFRSSIRSTRERGD